MVEYEVNLEVEAGIADDYRVWLYEHVTAMLALPGFLDASVLRVEEPVAAGHVGYCVRYRLRDATALTDYLRDHAAAMRAEGQARYGARFRAQRRVLTPLPDASPP